MLGRDAREEIGKGKRWRREGRGRVRGGGKDLEVT